MHRLLFLLPLAAFAGVADLAPIASAFTQLKWGAVALTTAALAFAGLRALRR